MHFDEADTAEVKDWVVKRLEDISDADADVLADYVLALVKSDEEEAQVRANCQENLEDFLREHTQKFVDDVFHVIRTKSYKSGKLAATATNVSNATGAAPFNPPTGPAAQQNGKFGNQQQNGSGQQSRKRGYHERDNSESADPHYGRNNGGERAMKQLRRGGAGQNVRGGRHSTAGQGTGSGSNSSFSAQQQSIPPMPPAPLGFPQLDPNDPMSAILAMQAMGFPPVPGFPPFPGVGGSPGSSTALGGFQPPAQKTGQRCRDYDTKGFCAKGSMCPYDHGSDHMVVPGVPEEYDPSNSSITLPNNNSLNNEGNKQSTRPTRGGSNGRGRGPRNRAGYQAGGGSGGSRGGQRAAFSSNAPNFDRSNTSIVVEQIPEEKFSEESVREFFSEFGEIESVNMQPYKRLAVVKYNDYNSARGAYDSPKVIFDNRFVKVYWYKPGATATPGQGAGKDFSGTEETKKDDEEMLDPEEFEKKQAEAQRAHEEKMKKVKEAQAAKEELDKRIKAQAEERKKLLEKLASKTGSTAGNQSSPSPGPNGPAARGTDDKTSTSTTAGGAGSEAKSSATEALRAKLAELEAEAETLGLGPEETNNTDAPSSYFYGGRGRGRGAPRSRGGPRGARGGSWRGFGAPAGGAVARLDNRPKSVRVVPIENEVNFYDTTADESLRAHLFSVGEFSSITPSSTLSENEGENNEQAQRANSAIVAFPQRYIAEMLLSSISPPAGNGSIPGLGKVRFEWVANSANAAAPSTSSSYTAPAASTRLAGSSTSLKGHGENNLGSYGGDEDGAMDTAGTEDGLHNSHSNGSGSANGQAQAQAQVQAQEDFDVAEDDMDRWVR